MMCASLDNNVADPEDYVGFPSLDLSFLSELVQCVDITIIDDSEFENLENFLFQISPIQSDPAVVLLPQQSTAVVLIVDPEDGVF